LEKELKNALNYAYNLLSYRNRTEFELKEKLLNKGYVDEIVNEVLDRLKNMNLINDMQFAEDFVEFKREKYGKIRIKNELYKKGISTDIIDEVLSYDLSYEIETIEKIVVKKLQEYGEIPFEKKYNRLVGLLARKGYSYDSIKIVLEKINFFKNK